MSRRLRKLISKYKLKVVALFEPFTVTSRVRNFPQLFMCDQFITNESPEGKIWVMWCNEVVVQVSWMSNQFITLKVKDEDQG